MDCDSQINLQNLKNGSVIEMMLNGLDFVAIPLVLQNAYSRLEGCAVIG